MTQYLLSVIHDVEGQMADFDPEAFAPVIAAVDAFNTEVMAAGAFVFAGGLCPPSAATVVRPQPDGEVLLTDGPFAETKEQLGGFWVIEAANLDEALVWAKKGAAACRNAVELRPFQSEPEA